MNNTRKTITCHMLEQTHRTLKLWCMHQGVLLAEFVRDAVQAKMIADGVKLIPMDAIPQERQPKKKDVFLEQLPWLYYVKEDLEQESYIVMACKKHSAAKHIIIADCSSREDADQIIDDINSRIASVAYLPALKKIPGYTSIPHPRYDDSNEITIAYLNKLEKDRERAIEKDRLDAFTKLRKSQNKANDNSDLV